MTSSSATTSRLRRLTARTAVRCAGRVALAALAIPASAATAEAGIPVVSQIADPDWNHDHGGDQDRHDRIGARSSRGPGSRPAPRAARAASGAVSPRR
ncbi:hypothetical protein [Nocardia aurantiaca]|uniref:Uncharacterized protein n=1 Tax=Nocardia aurantiaca TaxID=2675850 RepID=A0A6I3KYM4_9NOCA|nr:hypothetical protein [Nocardia aurantiaca]MTE15843.1 hypothetical protein [Nocardia aurantiaca]